MRHQKLNPGLNNIDITGIFWCEALAVKLSYALSRAEMCIRDSLLTFQHRAGVSSYTSSFDLAETCVFAKQSPGPIHCGSISGASLFPKLRDQFAEFLNYPSPVGLRILFPSTCVGLRYGHLRYSLSFSRPLFDILPYSNFGPFRPGLPSPGSCPFKVSLCFNLWTVTEYPPFVHRLRLSASP